MDQSSNTQNRKSRRSNVLMAASLELSGTSLPVKLRNLSADGALVEGDKLPVEGAQILFRKGDLLDEIVARTGVAPHPGAPPPREAGFSSPGSQVQ